jgi:hypothetical protein
MARDLYGELLSRALQRSAPAGHIPAYITPGEGRLLRSRGGGVAPGGGQYMANGIPTFSYGGEAGFGGGGGEGEPGDPGPGTGGGSDYGGFFGWEDAIAAGLSDAPGTGVYGGTTSDHDSAPVSLDMAALEAALNRGRAMSAAATPLDQPDIDQIDAEEAAAAAAAATAAAEAADAANTASFSSSMATALSNVTSEDQSELGLEESEGQDTLDAPDTDTGYSAGFLDDMATAVNSLTDLDEPDIQPDIAEFGWGVEDVEAVSLDEGPQPDPEEFGWNVEDVETDDYGYLDTLGGMPGSGPTGTGTAPGDTDDGGDAAQKSALALAQHEVNTGRMSQAQAFSALESPIDRGGLGRFSPAVGWGVNSETGLASFADLAALNAQDHTGYAINNPQPTEAGLLASQVFSQLNPTVTNAVIGLSGMLPGTIGFASFLAGMIEDKGLMNIPGVRSIPGIQALSDIIDIPGRLVSEATSAITEPVSDLLSQGQRSLAEALEDAGMLDSDDPGFLGAGGDNDVAGGSVDGDAPEIEFLPPVETPRVVEPLVARTFAEVDAATKNRILSNILSGLTRLGHSTEGVTAFGPLFVDER